MERILIDGASEILVGAGMPSPLLPERAGRTKAAVICQPGSRPVAERLIRELPAGALLEAPDRDEAKTMTVLAGVYQWLADQDIGRYDAIVGVGGGAVTDLAGFAAATWLRGIEWASVPTTLLGAVDAAIGGKTGINLAGKNLVGAFWHPARVIIDLEVLEELPQELITEGSAEAIKAGFIADPELVDEYEQHGAAADLAVVVPRAVAVKAAVVGEDFREGGRRAILNFGHTLGHGIEVVADMPHGHAVAVGMVAAAEVSHRRHGFDAARLRRILEGMGLPTRVEGVDTAAVLDLVARDKKKTSEGIRMVLLREVAQPVVEVVSPDELEYAARAVISA